MPLSVPGSHSDILSSLSLTAESADGVLSVGQSESSVISALGELACPTGLSAPPEEPVCDASVLSMEEMGRLATAGAADGFDPMPKLVPAHSEAGPFSTLRPEEPACGSGLTRRGGDALQAHHDPKIRKMDEQFAAAMARPPSGSWFRDEDGNHFIADEIGPTREFAALNLGGRPTGYFDDQGSPFTFDFTGTLHAEHPVDAERMTHYDKMIEDALDASTSDLKGGASSTGVRAWRKFCAQFGYKALRPLDAMAPLGVKLREERLVMRFIMWLVDSRDILASSAANYLGSVQGWHLRQTGVKLCAGLRLARVAEIVKGLKRLRGDPGRRVRKGLSPDVLRRQMDRQLDPTTVGGANMRAALSLGFQGLLRGAEFTVRQKKWNPEKDMSRADIADLSVEKAVVMMLPCKNMQHMNGKTVPLVVGGGGTFIDAPAELLNLCRVDPVSVAEQAATPLFRNADGSAITEAQVRSTIQALMADEGAVGADFGAHSLRIGGATALYRAGASHVDIMTMGRWSSDCYRLYVRSCLGHSVDWSRRAASTPVDYTAAVDEYKHVDCY